MKRPHHRKNRLTALKRAVSSAPMASILDLIGETPLIELTKFDCGPCQLFLKLESANPSGSIKDRPARFMIEAAEADGRLKRGSIKDRPARQSFYPAKSPRRSRGDQRLHIWYATMIGPMGIFSSLGSGCWASETGQSLQDHHGKWLRGAFDRHLVASAWITSLFLVRASEANPCRLCGVLQSIGFTQGCPHKPGCPTIW